MVQVLVHIHNARNANMQAYCMDRMAAWRMYAQHSRVRRAVAIDILFIHYTFPNSISGNRRW